MATFSQNFLQAGARDFVCDLFFNKVGLVTITIITLERRTNLNNYIYWIYIRAIKTSKKLKNIVFLYILDGKCVLMTRDNFSEVNRGP